MLVGRGKGGVERATAHCGFETGGHVVLLVALEEWVVNGAVKELSLSHVQLVVVLRRFDVEVLDPFLLRRVVPLMKYLRVLWNSPISCVFQVWVQRLLGSHKDELCGAHRLVEKPPVVGELLSARVNRRFLLWLLHNNPEVYFNYYSLLI